MTTTHSSYHLQYKVFIFIIIYLICLIFIITIPSMTITIPIIPTIIISVIIISSNINFRLYLQQIHTAAKCTHHQSLATQTYTYYQ